VLLLSMVTACAFPPVNGPRDFLDETHGLTLSIVHAPLVFARPRTDVAVNARDYATLVAVAEDQNGKHDIWLISHRWSTVDPRFGGKLGPRASALQLTADDRELVLNPTSPAPILMENRDELFAPRGSLSAAYALDASTLRFIASAQLLSVRYGDDQVPLGYTLWDDQRAAIRALLAQSPLAR
jgi:hypothetical protein